MKKTFLLSAAAALIICALGSCKSNTDINMSKDFLTLAAERYSVRHFTDEKVGKEDLGKILQAGRLAPTAVNSQPQKIYVIQSPELIEKMNDVSPCMYGAPQAFLFCYNDANVCKRGENGNYGDIDVTIVLTHMMLEAANLGIGTCIVGMFDAEKAIEALDIPEGIHPMLLMPFGYAAEDALPSKMHTSYRPESETIEYK